MAINKLLNKLGNKAETGEEREIEVPLTFIEREYNQNHRKRSESIMWKQAIEDALQKTKVNIERFGDLFPHVSENDVYHLNPNNGLDRRLLVRYFVAGLSIQRGQSVPRGRSENGCKL